MPMDQLATNFKRYLKETLDIDTCPNPWQGTGKLPLFLRNLYVFLEVPILQTPCLVMATKENAGQTPATVRKHMTRPTISFAIFFGFILLLLN